ncbi:MAG TPA: ABC transporter permease [Micromonosporaceae bacterium]|jgi:ABC-type transport system involved in multi-copper enzyme maturation permease subunit
MTAQTAIQPPTATPASTGSPALPGRSRLVRAELLKIFTTNTWWLFTIYALVATGLALLSNVINANSQLNAATHVPAPNFDALPPDQRPPADVQAQMLEQYREQTNVPLILARSAANVYTSGQFFGLLLIMIIGVLVVTNEFQHQTATATFLTTPQRTVVMVAKLAAAVLLAGFYWLISTAFGIGVGALNFSVQGYGLALTDSTVVRAVAMNLLAYVLLAVLGVGLGVLIRSQLGATLTACALYLLTLPAGLLLFGFIRTYVVHDDRVWNFAVSIPGIAAMVMVSAEPFSIGGNAQGVQWWIGALVLLVWAVLSGGIGTLITRRRDIS